MNPVKPIDALAAGSLFTRLNEADRARIVARMRPVRFEPGQLIFSRGDPGNGLYLVLSGRVRLSVLTSDGRELSLAHATDGAIFGEIASLDGGERTADATAITRIEALMLPQAALASLLREVPAIAEAIVHFLCSRLRETDQKLEAVALHPIEVRLARLILSLVEAKGQTGETAEIELGMSQSEVSLLIGASRPKVNAAFQLLEAEGAFVKTGQVLRCRIPALRRLAAG